MYHKALSEKQKSTSSSGVCSKDYGFILEAVDKGFVPSLIPRKEWNTEKLNVQVNDFVIVQNPNAICELEYRSDRQRLPRTR